MSPASIVEQRKMKRALTVVSLFSGCGGMDYGAKLAGCEVVFANDISADAVASFLRLLPDVDSVIGSCSQVKKLPKADIVCGGYPCQPFSLGGRRDPSTDTRSALYLDFVSVLNKVKPRYFVVENVPGMASLGGGAHFRKQLYALRRAGDGYRLTYAKLNAADFGVPQMRSRVFIVGVRKDLEQRFVFPDATHGPTSEKSYESAGGAISGLESWPRGDFYERVGGAADNFPWYYMSRNRRISAGKPAFTIVANWRHTPLHPASPVMKLTWSNLADGWKQRWDFSDEYDPELESAGLAPLALPRRLTWRECAILQSFPCDFEPVGSVQKKIEQIGNAVPPLLAAKIFGALVSGSGLVPARLR